MSTQQRISLFNNYLKTNSPQIPRSFPADSPVIPRRFPGHSPQIPRSFPADSPFPFPIPIPRFPVPRFKDSLQNAIMSTNRVKWASYFQQYLHNSKCKLQTSFYIISLQRLQIRHYAKELYSPIG